ncbi:MAG: hypothetical protein V1771_00665 [Chloroflexota bacterium]
MPHKNIESKKVKIGDVPFFTDLLDHGMVFQDKGPEFEVEVVACEGFYGEWAAYFDTPETPFHDVAAYGNKLPEAVATSIFPDWAKRLRWRP